MSDVRGECHFALAWLSLRLDLNTHRSMFLTLGVSTPATSFTAFFHSAFFSQRDSIKASDGSAAAFIEPGECRQPSTATDCPRGSERFFPVKEGAQSNFLPGKFACNAAPTGKRGGRSIDDNRFT